VTLAALEFKYLIKVDFQACHENQDISCILDLTLNISPSIITWESVLSFQPKDSGGAYQVKIIVESTLLVNHFKCSTTGPHSHIHPDET